MKLIFNINDSDIQVIDFDNKSKRFNMTMAILITLDIAVPATDFCSF